MSQTRILLKRLQAPLGHVCIALVLSTLMVVVPMGTWIFAIPWLIVVGAACRGELPRDRFFETLAVYVVVTAVVITVALQAPVKSSDRFLDETVVKLPRLDLSLGELDRNAQNNYARIPWMPRNVDVTTNPENAGEVIRFRARTISLREFTTTIESQSELRHRFVYCGNGYTVLWGGGGSLYLRVPREGRNAAK